MTRKTPHKLKQDMAKKKNKDAGGAERKSAKTERIVLRPEEKSAWRKALVVVHHGMENRICKDTIETGYKETGFKP